MCGRTVVGNSRWRRARSAGRMWLHRGTAQPGGQWPRRASTCCKTLAGPAPGWEAQSKSASPVQLAAVQRAAYLSTTSIWSPLHAIAQRAHTPVTGDNRMSTSVGQVMMLPALPRPTRQQRNWQPPSRNAAGNQSTACKLPRCWSAGITDACPAALRLSGRVRPGGMGTAGSAAGHHARLRASPLPRQITRRKDQRFCPRPLTMGPISSVLHHHNLQEFGRWQNQQVLLLGLAMLSSLLVTSGFCAGGQPQGSGYLSQGYVRAAGRIVGLILGLESADGAAALAGWARLFCCSRVGCH